MHKTRAQKARAATRSNTDEEPEFQIAPMIDILLVLLVFFMSIATDQVLQVNKEVVLPIAKVEKPTAEEGRSEVIVNIIWNEIGATGKIEVDGRGEMDSVKLTDYITQKREHSESKGIQNFRVVIRGDRRAKYEYVKTVMRSIGAAKVPTVTFSAVDKELDKPTP